MKTVGKNHTIPYPLTNPQACKTNQKNYLFYQVFNLEKGRFANPENDTPKPCLKDEFENAERQIQL